MTTNNDLVTRKGLEIILSEKMSRFTARDINRKYNEILHETNDYHVFSEYLDYLYNCKILKVVGHNSDGMTIYSLS